MILLRLNNKGFAISSIMYIILVLAVILIALILVNLSSRKLILDKLKSEVLTTIYEAPKLTYRQTLQQLKSESIAYIENESLEKGSLKIDDSNFSIDSNTLEKYKLNDKYVTAIQNTDSYNVYLGKPKIVENLTILPEDTLDIVDYKIYGNSIQNGTPSLETPIEVESVGDIVKNLFDKEAATIGIGLSTSNGGTYSTSNYFTTDYIKIEKSKIYYYNWENPKWYCFYDENKNFINYGSSSSSFSNSSATYVRFSVDISELDSFQIQEGVRITGDETSGYKISVKVRGKNIAHPNAQDFTSNGLTVHTNEDQTITITGSVTESKSTILTLTGRGPNNKYWHDFIIYPTEKVKITIRNVETGELSSIAATSQWQGVETGKTYYGNNYKNATEPVYFSRLYTQQNLTAGENIYAGTWKIQVELGDKETEYQPYVESKITNIYLDEPLRKIDSYVDYIDSKNSKAVRNVKEFELTGKQNLNLNSYFTNAYGYSIQTSYVNDYLKSSLYGFSNYFIKQNHSSKLTSGILFGQNINMIIPYEANLPTVEDFKGKLKELYDSGNPVKIYYIMSEENSVNAELPKIQVPEGAVDISIDTSLKPSSYEFTILEKIIEI